MANILLKKANFQATTSRRFGNRRREDPGDEGVIIVVSFHYGNVKYHAS